MASSSSSSPEISAPLSRHQTDSQSPHAKLHEVLEDLSSRFILNLPQEELESLERVCFQVEQAHWYYEDFTREQDPSFPTMTLKKFSNSLFHVCPLLRHWGDDHEQTFQNFLAYKTRVPVCGAIMLNHTWDKCLLVKGWKSTAAWSFPKGKINEQEPRHRCAVREVLEETGYDLDGQVNPEDVVELSIKEQSISLFIVPNVPEDYPFKTRTRKEISKIAWFKLSDLPTWKRNRAVPGKFYLITPFISPLRAFIRERKLKDLQRKGAQQPTPHQEGQHASSDEDVNANVSCTVPQDATTQESGSQSSSAENGEPQTPSPHYSEPLVNHTANGHVAAQQTENESQVLDMSGVDPHFARLLNGLSLSATGVPLVKGTTPVGPKSPKPPTSGAHPPALPIDVGKISHPIHSSSTVAASPHNLPRSPSIKPNGTLPHASRSPSPLTPSSLTDSKQSTSTISTQVPVSPRVPTTRRSSGISADISPYLSRATAAPVIPKQIKYLAMLENVAKESERATPNLERQLVSTHGAINHISHERPPPSSSVPPHMMGRPLEPPVLYSSGPGVPPSSLGLNPYLHQPTLPAQPVYDPFTVRPRTSNAFHPIPYPPHFPRASMNEEQFRLMISGPGPRPAPPNYAGLQRPGPPLLPSFTSRSFAPHSVSSHTNNSQPPLHIVPPQFMSVYQHPEPGPLSAPATSPTFNLFSRANPSNNAQLLSILNTPNIPRAAPSMPRTLG